MTDLHTHILPGMDDGARDCRTAAELLEMEAIQGVHNLALTSHFSFAGSVVDDFLDRRAQAYEQLRESLADRDFRIRMKLGCEVMYAPGLINQPVHRLCLEGTDVLLLELPTNYNPPFVQETLEYLRADGLIPVIAHVERYPYVMQDPRILAEWVNLGAYAQVNGASLLRGDARAAMIHKLIKWNLVHLLATDTHSPKKRPPVLRQAFREVEKQCGPQKTAWLRQNAEALFNGQEPEFRKPHVPTRILGIWL